MLHQEKVEVRKTQLVFIMMRRKPSYCSGRGRIYSTKACPGVSVQQPVGICLEEQTQPFHWVGRLRKMTISSEDYCSNIALSPKSNFLRPYCLKLRLSIHVWIGFVCHICFCCHLPTLFVIFFSVATFHLCLSYLSFLDALASLKTMFKIHSVTHVFKITRSKSIREF